MTGKPIWCITCGMKDVVALTRKAEKDLRIVPKYIVILFDEWQSTIEIDGFNEMQKIKSYRDHVLRGDRKGQRSSSLTKSYRVIYEIQVNKSIRIIEVQKVSKHDYKK